MNTMKYTGLPRLNLSVQKLYLLTGLLFASFLVQAQDVTISELVIDGNTKDPLPFATITLTESGSNVLITGSVSNELGYFILEGDLQGGYTVKVSYIGFNDWATDLLLGELNRNFDLGKVALKPSSENLDEVEVAALRNEVAADLDKKTFSMENMPAGSGGSVLEAMKSLPGVTIDQEGRVILRGSDKVVVLIDGKQSSLTGFGNQKGLDNIPAANIEKIEIINNPSARYDARGMAGIINIIYKKEQQEGFNGDIGFAYGIGAITKPKADLPTDLGSYGPNPKYIPTLNMNYRKDRLNSFLLAETMVQKNLPNNEFTTRTYDDGRVTASQVPENRTQQHHILNGGLEYAFRGNNFLVLSGIYDWERHVDTAQVPYINMADNSRYRYTTGGRRRSPAI